MPTLHSKVRSEKLSESVLPYLDLEVDQSAGLSESPARPAVQPEPRKPLEARAAEEKLDELWALAIYQLALAFNFLERP